jgi:hypothetical protein
MRIAARLGLGLAVMLSLGVATLDAAPGSENTGARQHFVCNKEGYKVKKCQKDIAVLKKALERYPVEQLGEWTWFLVTTSDWKEFQRSHGSNPDSPAFTHYAGRETFVEGALLTGEPTRVRELMLLWGMGMESLLKFAITHELGHALCNEKDEGKANRAAELLREGRVPDCKVQHFQAESRR